jgi:hypothetical protein
MFAHTIYIATDQYNSWIKRIKYFINTFSHISMNLLSIKLYWRENQWCICQQPNNDVFFCKSYIKVYHIVYDNGGRSV